MALIVSHGMVRNKPHMSGGQAVGRAVRQGEAGAKVFLRILHAWTPFRRFLATSRGVCAVTPCVVSVASGSVAEGVAEHGSAARNC